MEEITSGTLLEQYTKPELQRYFKLRDVTQTDEDYLRGTDYFITDQHGREIRLDMTLDIERKLAEGKSTIIEQKEYDNNGFLFHVDIAERTGNVVTDFDEPVLVVAVQNYGNYLMKSNNIDAMESYWALIPQIFDDALSIFQERQYEKEVREDPLSIGDLKVGEQTNKLKNLAIQLIDKEDAIELASYIADPSEKQQLMLIEKDYQCIDEFLNPTEKAVEYSKIFKEAYHIKLASEHPNEINLNTATPTEIAVADGMSAKEAILMNGTSCHHSLSVLKVLEESCTDAEKERLFRIDSQQIKSEIKPSKTKNLNIDVNKSVI